MLIQKQRADDNNIIKQEQEEGDEDRPYTIEEMFNAAQDI